MYPKTRHLRTGAHVIFTCSNCIAEACTPSITKLAMAHTSFQISSLIARMFICKLFAHLSTVLRLIGSWGLAKSSLTLILF